MKSFRYLLDPLCVSGCALYAANRWGIKPHTHLPLFRFWFNDALLIPCALPPVLLAQRWLQLRTHDGAPTIGEILSHLVIWSLLFEVIGARWMRHATSDPLDVLAYAFGALVAGVWWHRRRLFHATLHRT